MRDCRSIAARLIDALKLFGRFAVVVGLPLEWVMTDQSTTLPTVVTHGAARLPSVDVDSYNVELKDDEGLLGDRANKGAFTAILERWRKPLRKAGNDPFGDEASEDIALLEAIPTIGEHEAVILMHNDAVVQGLSEAPSMLNVTHWGVLTIGTGLGNARFTNRTTASKD